MNTNNLTYQFKQVNVVVKLIAINTLILLVVYLVAFFLQIPQESLTSWFVLPTNLVSFLTQPWSIITYTFLHGNFWHLFWNMYLLYWFGSIVLNLFTTKRFLTIYLLGAISGGLLYVAAYNIFPVFGNVNANLLGASAAVLAIVIFIATYTPNTEVKLFMFTLKLWQIGLAMVLLDLIQLPTSGNAGGLIAHMGGALFGYLYATQLSKGNDIGKWFENMMDWFVNLFQPKTKKPFKKVHRTSNQKFTRSKEKPSEDYQKKIDVILDKIGKSGYDSLTKTEKDFLFKAGKK